MNPLLQGMQTNLINQAIRNNPQLKQAIDYVNANGGNPKEAFYKLAKEKGVNPEEFLKSNCNYIKN